MNSIPNGLLKFARRLHAKCPDESSAFYHWQYVAWLGLFQPLEHDRYLNLLEERRGRYSLPYDSLVS